MSSTLFLYGQVAEKFGSKHHFKVDSLADCIVMLGSNYSKAEMKKEFGNQDFEIIRNDKRIGQDDIHMKFDTDNEFHLVPIVAGAGNSKGIWQIVAGVALIAISFYAPAAAYPGYSILTAGTIGTLGASLVLSGIGTMMAPSLEADYGSREDKQKPSYVFNGPLNVTEQGATIPLGFGEFICSSIVIGTELQNEDI